MASNELLQLPLDWFTTYEKLTAESVLAYAGVELPPDMLGAQLAANHSFYARLVKVPALVTFNSLFNGQCRDMQTYCQERLIEYILSGVEQQMVSEAQVALKDSIEETRVELIALGELLSDLEARHYQLMTKVYSLQAKQVVAWHKTINEQVDKLWQAMKNCQPDMNDPLKKRLIQLLRQQAAGILIPEEVIDVLKIKELPSATQKAVIQIYIEAEMLKVSRFAKPADCIQSIISEDCIATESLLLEQQKTLELERNKTILPEVETFQQKYNGAQGMHASWANVKAKIDAQLLQVRPHEPQSFPAEKNTVESIQNQEHLTAPSIPGVGQ